MGYAVYNLRGSNYGRKDSDARKFEEAAMMVEEGLECMRELADEMEEKYSQRRYDMRSIYGRRDYDMWDDEDMMHERRRRDSRGRYM